LDPFHAVRTRLTRVSQKDYIEFISSSSSNLLQLALYYNILRDFSFKF